MSRRQDAASDPGFSGGRQRPQVAGDAGLVAGFNCFAVCGVACAEGGVETEFSMYMDVQVSRAAGDGETGTGREAGPGHAASELSLGHMCAAAALGRCVVNEREAAGRRLSARS